MSEKTITIPVWGPPPDLLQQVIAKHERRKRRLQRSRRILITAILGILCALLLYCGYRILSAVIWLFKN